MDLRENALTLVASVTINMKTETKQTIFTVPTGKTFIPFCLVVRNPSATLVGAVDSDFGSGANADTWLLQISLNAFTATTDYGVLMQPDQAAGPPIVPTKKTIEIAGAVWGILVNTVATGAATVTMDLYGYLADA